MSSTKPHFRNYWDVYGGFSAVFKSRYFWGAFGLTVLTGPWWFGGSWWERVLAIEPTMLGFSLGGYVMLLAVGSERFMELLAKAGQESGSALVGVSAAFVHFIMVQFMSLVLALLFVASQERFWAAHNLQTSLWLKGARAVQEGVTMLVFFYTLTTGMAATLRIFSLTNLYVAMARQPHELPGESAANPLFVTLVEPQPTAIARIPATGLLSLTLQRLVALQRKSIISDWGARNLAGPPARVTASASPASAV